MKNTNIVIKLACCIIASFTPPASELYARIGCMDKSCHLKKTYDYKNYHYVHCDCPCEKHYKMSLDKGICPNCGHCHAPLGFEILNIDKDKTK